MIGRSHSPLVAGWWKVAGVVNGEPVKAVGRILWGLAPLRAIALRVAPIRRDCGTRGPYRPFTPALVGELFHRLTTAGAPDEIRATEIEDLPGIWLVFTEPGSPVADPLPEVREEIVRAETVSEPVRVRQSLQTRIPSTVPEPPTASRQKGRSRAWRLGYMAGLEGRDLWACPYEGNKGSAGANRSAWLAGYGASKRKV